MALAGGGIALAAGSDASTPGCTNLGSSCGDETNAFGNGWDVKGQAATYDNVVISYPNTTSDRATDFIRFYLGSSTFRFEYAPNGSLSGLCVSDPGGGYVGDPGGPDGLVLRGCNTGPFQQFRTTAGSSTGGYQWTDVATGLTVHTNGTSAPLSDSSLSSGAYFGGSFFKWVSGVTSTAVTAKATTAITNDADTGHGTPAAWNSENLSRNATVTREGAVALSDCPGAPTTATCWSYHGSVNDSNGLFTTLAGAKSPNAGTAILGTGPVKGKMFGSASFSFFASSGSPNGALVDGSLNLGCTTSSMPLACTNAKNALPAPETLSGWFEQFFPSGTKFGGTGVTSYSYTYDTTSACVSPVQQWVDSSSNSDGSLPGDGDITGSTTC